MKYTAKGRLNRHFEVTDDTNVPLGSLDYPTWYAKRTAAITTQGKTYNINPLGIFKRGIGIMSGDTKIGLMKFGVLGRMAITMEDGTQYTFKRVGFFNGYMALFNEHGHELIKMKQDSMWAIWNLSYTIDADDNYKEAKDVFLLLLLIYCINYMIAMSYAA